MRVEVRVGDAEPIVVTQPTIIRIGTTAGVFINEYGWVEAGWVDPFLGTFTPDRVAVDW